MRAITITVPDYLAQSTGQVTLTTFIGAVLALYFALTIIGSFRHPSGPGFIQLAVLFSAIYLGWTAAHWPGVNYHDGLLLGMWNMTVSSTKIITAAVLDLLGADSMAQAIRDGMPQ